MRFDPANNRLRAVFCVWRVVALTGNAGGFAPSSFGGGLGGGPAALVKVAWVVCGKVSTDMRQRHCLPLVPASLAGAGGFSTVGSVPPGDAAPGALQRHRADASMGHAFNALLPTLSARLCRGCPARGVFFCWQIAKPASCALPAPLALTPTLSQAERGSSRTGGWVCHRSWPLQERTAQCSL